MYICIGAYVYKYMHTYIYIHIKHVSELCSVNYVRNETCLLMFDRRPSREVKSILGRIVVMKVPVQGMR